MQIKKFAKESYGRNGAEQVESEDARVPPQGFHQGGGVNMVSTFEIYIEPICKVSLVFTVNRINCTESVHELFKFMSSPAG
jgi:hypothetical protein